MSMLDEMLQYNETFVERNEFEELRTDKFPDKKMVILTCMDTRLTELLPRAINIKNGDAKIIKSAGAILTHPFGGVMRSILVAVYELGAEEVFVIGHHGCGMSAIDPQQTISTMVERGIPKQNIDILEAAGVDLHAWLHGFGSVEDSVRHTVETIKKHPLLLPSISIHGLVIHPETGKLDVVVNGNDPC